MKEVILVPLWYGEAGPDIFIFPSIHGAVAAGGGGQRQENLQCDQIVVVSFTATFCCLWG
jgi:hypothetical protein